MRQLTLFLKMTKRIQILIVQPIFERVNNYMSEKLVHHLEFELHENSEGLSSACKTRGGY